MQQFYTRPSILKLLTVQLLSALGMFRHIQGLSRSEWRKVRRVLKPALSRRPRTRLLTDSILLLEKAHQRHPDEWTYLYILGDYYQRLDLIDLSVYPLLRCYTLRPDDSRCAYALATAYRFTKCDKDDALMAYGLLLKVLKAPMNKFERRIVLETMEALLLQHPSIRRTI